MKDGKLDCQAARQVVLQGRIAVQIARHQPHEKMFLTKAIGVTRQNIDTLNLSLIQAPADYRPR